MNRHLDNLRLAIVSATAGMTPADLHLHPEGKWCAAEILEHLSITYSGTVAGLERCLSQGQPLARTPALRDRFGTFLVVSLGYMPEGRKAPARTEPKGVPGPQVLSRIVPQIEEMDKLIAECSARFGARTLLMDHPILGPLTAGQWCKFHWVHGRHHMRQVSKLRRDHASLATSR
jgi:hypothetical protein